MVNNNKAEYQLVVSVNKIKFVLRIFLSTTQSIFVTLVCTWTDDSLMTKTNWLKQEIRLEGHPNWLEQLNNKLTIYKTFLRPSWLYAVEVWGSAKASNLARIQRFQSKVLHYTLDGPWFVSNHTIHTDLQITTMTNIIKSKFQKFHSNPSIRPNPLVQALSSSNHSLNPPRDLLH